MFLLLSTLKLSNPSYVLNATKYKLDRISVERAFNSVITDFFMMSCLSDFMASLITVGKAS